MPKLIGWGKIKPQRIRHGVKRLPAHLRAPLFSPLLLHDALVKDLQDGPDVGRAAHVQITQGRVPPVMDVPACQQEGAIEPSILCTLL
jgi:hypothetical protein